MNTEMKNEAVDSPKPEAPKSPEPKSRALRWIAYVAVVAVVMSLGSVAVLKVVSRIDAGHDVETNHFGAEISINGDEKYVVEISENDRGLGPDRIMHLSIDGHSSNTITGHDYNADGRWDRVFYCGPHPMVPSSTPAYGCNSVVRMSDGWEFEPCSADKDKLWGFTPQAIAFAIRRLDLALDEVRQEKHLTRRWLWDEKQKSLVRVFPPTSNT